jgi:hypothetical protein
MASDNHGNKGGKISWSLDNMLVFADVCIEHMEKRGRGQKFIWNVIEVDFQKRSNLN